jgi:hypothetical protein
MKHLATLRSLAKEYADYLVLNRFDPGASAEILRRIGRITHVLSKESLPPDLKRQLVEAISDEALAPKVPTTDLAHVEVEDEPTELLKLVTLLRNTLPSAP